MSLTLDDITKCPQGYEYRTEVPACSVPPCPSFMGCYPISTSTTTTTTTLSTSTPTTTTTLPLGLLCPPGSYWDGTKCSLIYGNPSVPTLPNGQPSIPPYGGYELPIAINCRNANGTYDYKTGLCIQNTPAPAPFLPNEIQSLVTNKDNTQKYILYALLGLVAYKVFIK
jgi:hypothetical protein